MRTHFIFTLALLLITACGLETEPDPNYQSASGNGGSGGSGGSDAGDAGGEGGTTGGSGGNGGTSGSGGSGGDSAVTDCDDNNACSPNIPQCNSQGRCVSCTSNAACQDRGPLKHCDTARNSDHRGQCVACLEDDHCQASPDGQYCLNNECVPCKADADCTDLTKPQCGMNGQCTGCTSSDACDGRNGTEVCVTTAGPKRGHCVACVAHADCPSADAPQCLGNNTCGACISNAACTFRDDTKHCNTRRGVETSGHCVECTGATEDDDCDGNSCKQSTGECTNVTKSSRNPCQSCEADSECSTGNKCVEHVLGSAELGHFCFPVETAAGCASDTNPLAKPYSQTLANTLSIDGIEASQQATYCLPRTSCEALDDASATVSPGVATCMVNTDCGASGINDGACIPRGMDAVLTCTYRCDHAYECPADAPKCEGDPDKYCSP